MSAISTNKDGKTLLNVKVHPKSSKKCVKITDEFVEIYVTDPPEKGKANAEVIKLLSKEFNVSKSSIEIIKGETARLKKVLIHRVL